MIHQEIIALAKDAGLSFIPEANSPLVRIVMMAVEMEREACALVVSQALTNDQDFLSQVIRARGDQQ